MKSYVYLKESSDETLIFEVRSDSRKRGETHDVYFDKDNGWVCTCEDYYYRRRFCKHMRMAQDYYKSFIEFMNSDFVWRKRD